MPYVQIAKDLKAVKTKVVFNLTKRQLICFGSAAVTGVPAYIFTRGAIGNSAAVLLMIGIMLPMFFFAMYEKDSMPAEVILINYIRSQWFFPKRRPYRTENFYAVIEQEGKNIDGEQKADSTEKSVGRRKKSGKNK
jgi:hypothetical protein